MTHTNKAHKRRSTSRQKVGGFTIIEVLIVMVIAGLILSLIFLAYPAVQRNSRNTRRDSDAAQIALAIGECMINSNQNLRSCDSRAEISFDDSNWASIPVFITGQIGNVNPIPDSPTLSEPNWLFKLRCNNDHTWFINTDSTVNFVVTYYRENSDGTPKSRCIEG